MNNNLNENLLPIDSPIASQQGAISSYLFDSQNERNAISQSKISFISADKIASGTVIVGLNLGSTGSGYSLLDGANNRILVNDGTTNRIVLGKVS